MRVGEWTFTKILHRDAFRKVKLRRGVRVATVVDGQIVMNARGQIMHLDESSCAVLDALLGQGIRDAVATVQSRRGLTSFEAHAAVQDFAEQLSRHRIVRVL